MREENHAIKWKFIEISNFFPTRTKTLRDNLFRLFFPKKRSRNCKIRVKLNSKKIIISIV